MRRLLALTSALAFCIYSVAGAQQKNSTDDIVRAAESSLGTLSAEQRQKVMYAFDDATQRARWSNFPTGFVPRGGISLKQMSMPQHEAAMNLLGTVLSPMGLEKVNEIRQADVGGRGPGGPGGPGGQPPGGGDMFGGDLYFISFLGIPSAKQPWMLQFGGHHLALNITISASKGVLTPTLTGAQPALFRLNGKTIRPVGRESDKALALLKTLWTKHSASRPSLATRLPISYCLSASSRSGWASASGQPDRCVSRNVLFGEARPETACALKARSKRLVDQNYRPSQNKI